MSLSIISSIFVCTVPSVIIGYFGFSSSCKTIISCPFCSSTALLTFLTLYTPLVRSLKAISLAVKPALRQASTSRIPLFIRITGCPSKILLNKTLFVLSHFKSKTIIVHIIRIIKYCKILIPGL